MTKSTITRERLEWLSQISCRDDIEDIGGDEIRELASMALSAMDSEPVAVVEPSDYVTAAQLVGEGPARKAVHELYEGALRIGDKLYRHAQPATVVMDDEKLRALFDAWFASDCSFDLSPEASEADNIAWRESYWYAWQRCRTAMLQAGNFPGIGIDPASGPDCTAEVRYVAPTGYVMVPKEPTEAILDEFDSIIDHGAEDSEDAWRRLLAAAPQEVKP
ncbi:TPA: hypothetical protein MYT98_002906 [Klebsiella aerogenes]|uniref:hypothetical protein n=1 Tax=Klebsiella aerogenes TaxID=548 RepID=UPI00388E1049|nr:hypothetical protein [Klebsiella aerogenes]HCM1703170.1 hypothetical protein [Klebsiella aerogenes]